MNNSFAIELTDEQLEDVVGGYSTHFEHEYFKHEVTEYDRVSFDYQGDDDDDWGYRRHRHRHHWHPWNWDN
jgi:hypothetical protein